MNPWVYYPTQSDLGVRLAEQNRLADAIECFNQAIAINPQYPSSYNNRAQAYQLQNKTQGQFDYYSPMIEKTILVWIYF